MTAESKLLKIIEEPGAIIQLVEFYNAGKVAIVHRVLDGKVVEEKFEIDRPEKILHAISENKIKVRSHFKPRFSPAGADDP